MSKTFIIPLAMLAILGTSGAVFAAQTSDNLGQQQLRHMNHVSAQHRTDAPHYARLPWNLPDGWPQS